jgi:hypothetical protein
MNVDLVDLGDQDFSMLFPGNLFSVQTARAIGGVRPNYCYTGDWDLWFRLARRGGAAQTAATVAVARFHYGAERRSMRADRLGWRWAPENAQHKRNLTLLQQQKGIQVNIDRTKKLHKSLLPSKVLLQNAHGYSRWILAYNAWLFVNSSPPYSGYAAFQWMVRLFGPQALVWVGKR